MIIHNQTDHYAKLVYETYLKRSWLTQWHPESWKWLCERDKQVWRLIVLTVITEKLRFDNPRRIGRDSENS